MSSKSPRHLAEGLARKCAVKLIDLKGHSHLAPNEVNNYTSQILQSIPLVELLECTRKLFNAQRDYRRQYSNNLKELDTFSTPHDKVLTNLTTKLHQLGIKV